MKARARTQMLADLVQSVISGFEEGRKRYGDLGLEVETYVQRIRSIIHKHLGTARSEEDMVCFARSLHGRDLYLTTACAQESTRRDAGKNQYESQGYPSLAW